MRRAIIVSLFVYLFVGAGGVRPATPADAGCADPSPSNPSPADPDSQRWIGLYQIDPQCNPTKETPCVFVDATMFDAEFVHPRAYAGANAGGPYLTIRPPSPGKKAVDLKFSRLESAASKRNTKLVWIKFVSESVLHQPVLARCVKDANGNQILYVEPIPGG
jgi:hypothetical protein